MQAKEKRMRTLLVHCLKTEDSQLTRISTRVARKKERKKERTKEEETKRSDEGCKGYSRFGTNTYEQ
jgi:hypothetical protein